MRLSIPDRQMKKAYQASQVDRIFRHKASADDSAHFFDFGDNPILCTNGIKIRTNTNCRPIFYVE